MIFNDKFRKKYHGNYRAKIEAVDTTNKNGIYQVRVYPFMANLNLNVLPNAASTFSTRFQHINLKVGDWVWVFFENGDQHFPVIFDLCNFKGSYPTPVVGTYGKYTKFAFGKFTFEIDEDKNELIIKDENDNKIDISSNGIVFQNGSNGTDQFAIKQDVDDLKAKLNDFISKYNLHTHATPSGPASPTPSVETPLTVLTYGSPKIKITKGS